jgi:hypothetical protein
MLQQHNLHSGGLHQQFVTGPMGLNVKAPGYNEALGGTGSAAMQAAGQMAAAKGGAYQGYAQGAGAMYGPYAQAAASAGNNYAQMFDAYSRGAGQYFNNIANLGANALAQGQNANQDRYSAYAQGAGSFNNLLGSLGTSALAAYGSAANAAMQAQAMNSTAALKAMADAAGQNQQATSLYGASRNQALAGLAAALGNAGTGFANARATNSNSAANLAGTGATAQSNLAAALAAASGNLASSAGQNEAALRAAVASGLANTSQAESAALANTNVAGSSALAGLAPSMTAAASNDLNYTRDMAKLGLARELGLTSANVAGSMMGSQPSWADGVSMYGPDGMIASGSSGGWADGVAPGQYAPVNPQANQPWYTQPQFSDGSGLAALQGLQGDLAGGTAAGLNAISSPASSTRSLLSSQAADGVPSMRSAMDQGMSRIDSEGVAARGGITDALLRGQDEISAARTGIDADAATTFGGLESTRGDMMAGDILSSLNDNYSSSMGMLQDAFRQGQRDPRSIYEDVYGNVSSLLSPLVDKGTSALNQFYGNFPLPVAGVEGGQLDPTPYLNAMQAAYDPFMSNLNAALLNQNNMVAGSLGTAASQLGSSRSALGSNFNNTLTSIDKTAEDSVNRLLKTTLKTPAQQAMDEQDAVNVRARFGDFGALNTLRNNQRNLNQFNTGRLRVG